MIRSNSCKSVDPIKAVMEQKCTRWLLSNALSRCSAEDQQRIKAFYNTEVRNPALLSVLKRLDGYLKALYGQCKRDCMLVTRGMVAFPQKDMDVILGIYNQERASTSCKLRLWPRLEFFVFLLGSIKKKDRFVTRIKGNLSLLIESYKKTCKRVSCKMDFILDRTVVKSLGMIIFARKSPKVFKTSSKRIKELLDKRLDRLDDAQPIKMILEEYKDEQKILAKQNQLFYHLRTDLNKLFSSYTEQGLCTRNSS